MYKVMQLIMIGMHWLRMQGSYYNLYEWGVYTPNVINIWYTPEHTDIEGIESEDEKH